MLDEKPAEIDGGAALPGDTVVETPTDPNAPTDPIDVELEKAKKTNRTELEKATFKGKQVLKRVKELGGDPASLLDTDPEPVTPAVVGNEVSLALVDELNTDEKEKELLKHYLTHTIKPSGKPSEDLKNARALVNQVRNSQILDEQRRKEDPAPRPSGSGGPAKPPEEEFVPTPEEERYMKGFGRLTKEQIIAARKAGAQQK